MNTENIIEQSRFRSSIRTAVISIAVLLSLLLAASQVHNSVYAKDSTTDISPGILYTNEFTAKNGYHNYTFEAAGDLYTITLYCRHAYDPYTGTGVLIEGVPADEGCTLPVDAWYEKDGHGEMNDTGMEGFSFSDPELTDDGWYRSTAKLGVFQKGDIIDLCINFGYDSTKPGYIGPYKFIVNGKALPARNTPAKTGITGLKSGKRSFIVKWKKVSKASGYQVQYSLKKDFANAKKKTVKKAGTISAKIKGLKSNKRYYVRVRSYKNVGGKKYYSAWSAKKSIKTR